MKNDSRNFYTYNTWANTRVFDHLQQLPKDMCYETIQSIFPSVFDVLTHIYIIDKGWHSVLIKEYASDDYETIKTQIEHLQQELQGISLGDFKERYNVLSRQLHAFINNNDLDSIETFASVPMSYADVFLHIVNHGTYHRGNISAMLHQLGQKGVPTDYGMYLYFQGQK